METDEMVRGRDFTFRRGFTLIELLVVISILALLIGVLLPALSGGRDAARQAACLSNQRQIGVAAMSYAQANEGFLCSGPWDNRKKRSWGPLESTGWIADMVNGEYAKPGKMLCPSHPAKYTQNLRLERVNDAPWKTYSEAERDELIDRGMNSNYTQSWFMAYTEMKQPLKLNGDPLSPTWTIGPLHEKYLSTVNASMVPLMADGRTDAMDPAEFISYQGEQLPTTKAVTDGPILRDTEKGTLAWQDYDDWGPAHGRGNFSVFGSKGHDRINGNVVFADGHATTFRDVDNNKEFGGVRDSRQQVVYPDFGRSVFGGHLSSGRFW